MPPGQQPSNPLVYRRFPYKIGDAVIVIAGKEKGKRGKVLRLERERHRVVVEGLNRIKRHTRPTRAVPQGGIIEKEAGIHVSNVMYWDEDAERPLRASQAFARRKAERTAPKPVKAAPKKRAVKATKKTTKKAAKKKDKKTAKKVAKKAPKKTARKTKAKAK